jgi:hypothetical protein
MNAEFEVHILNEDGIIKAQEIASAFNDLLNEVEAITGHTGRYPAIVRTKLEEAAFFSKKAMAVLPANQRGINDPNDPGR